MTAYFKEMQRQIVGLCQLKEVVETIYSPWEDPGADEDYPAIVHDAPLDEAVLRRAEQQYGFALPEDFFYFLTHIGNGSNAPFPLGIDPFPLGNEQVLNRLGTAHQVDIWQGPPDYLVGDRPVDDQPGLLELGASGMQEAYLIITGEFCGRILLTVEHHSPYLAPQKNFLEWYLGALQESAAGYDMLVFGRCLYGDAEHIMQRYHLAENEAERLHAISSLEKFCAMNESELEKLYRIYILEKDKENGDFLRKLLMRLGCDSIRGDALACLMSDRADDYIHFLVNGMCRRTLEWRDEIVASLPYLKGNGLSLVFQQVLPRVEEFTVASYLEFFHNAPSETKCRILCYFHHYGDLRQYIDEFFSLLQEGDSDLVMTVARDLACSDDDRLYDIYIRLTLEQYPLQKLGNTGPFQQIAEYFERRGERFETILGAHGLLPNSKI